MVVNHPYTFRPMFLISRLFSCTSIFDLFPFHQCSYLYLFSVSVIFLWILSILFLRFIRFFNNNQTCFYVTVNNDEIKLKPTPLINPKHQRRTRKSGDCLKCYQPLTAESTDYRISHGWLLCGTSPARLPSSNGPPMLPVTIDGGPRCPAKEPQIMVPLSIMLSAAFWGFPTIRKTASSTTVCGTVVNILLFDINDYKNDNRMTCDCYWFNSILKSRHLI